MNDVYLKLYRKLIGMSGGLAKSAKYGLNRDPASGQLKTIEKLLELAKKTGDKELIKTIAGVKGGLEKSMRYGLGRYPAKGQMETVKKILNIVKKKLNK